MIKKIILQVWQVAPVYPAAHVHVKLVPTTLQVAPFKHGFTLHGLVTLNRLSKFLTLF